MKELKTALAVLVLGLAAAWPAVAETVDFGARGAREHTNLTLDQMMIYAMQDEYLARAEYALILRIFEALHPFTHIITTEERHIAWLTDLFAGHGLGPPADTAAEHLLVPGDIEESLKIGIEAEIENIAMYAAFLEKDLPAEVSDLFSHLMHASENHLRAFRNNLDRHRRQQGAGA